MRLVLFFVSLEIKREFLQGELSNPKQALLPIIGAIGGMAVPALFILLNIQTVPLKGWAIPSILILFF